MNTVSQPAFSSPELQAALDKARETLEGSDEARNRVSEDIKTLERYLVSLKLTPPFRHPLGKYLIPEDEQTVASSLEYGGCASGKIAQDALLFDKDSNGKMRMLYESSRWDGQIDIDGPGGPYFWNSDTLEREVRPLIETKFEVRKKVYGQLPAFVTALAKHYAIDLSKLVDTDEIPF